MINNKNKLSDKTYLSSIRPDIKIPILTQNTKLTGIRNLIISRPTITFPVGIINPKKIDIIAPINSIVLYGDIIKWFKYLKDNLSDEKLTGGFISELYSPKDDKNIKKGERVFYTTRNANYIDTERQLLDNVPEPYHTLLLAPLLYEASNRTNTSGVFKGFYKNSETNIGQFGGNGKNALHRILSNIEVKKPVLSNFNCVSHVYKDDTLLLSETLPKMDLVYLDPPYNQHPYGSNYFMLNLINNYKKPDAISEVSGIPKKWNKSDFNKKATALSTMEKICNNLKAEYILISFNSEGFISFEDMVKMLSKYGSVRVYDQKYSTFKASRNLRNRNLYVNEYLFLLKKESE